jgi:hypothetical protein
MIYGDFDSAMDLASRALPLARSRDEVRSLRVTRFCSVFAIRFSRYFF